MLLQEFTTYTTMPTHIPVIEIVHGIMNGVVLFYLTA